MVMEGFTLGIAIIIALQQLPLILNVPKGKGTETVRVAFETINNALSTSLAWSSIVIALLTVGIKTVWTKYRARRSWSAKIPASAVAVVVMTLLTHIFHIELAVIGDIPNPFSAHPSFAWPGIPVAGFVYAALSIAALAAIESLLSARVADSMAHRLHQSDETHQPNRELIGQGIATIGSALFGGLPATGAIARTSVNVHAGAKTRWSAAIHAVALLVMALLLGHIVGLIPVAVVAGVLLGTSLRIANPTAVREFLQTTYIERITYITTAVAVVAIDLIWGTILGVCVHALLQRFSKASHDR
jgi:SulP family sulfate permease